MKQLSDIEITIVEAIYVCTIKEVLPIELEEGLLEMIFHCLSLLESSNCAIYIMSPIFDKLELSINLQSEWLKKDFYSISAPFPLKEYKNLHVIECFSQIDKKEKSITFCSSFYFKLFKNEIFEGQENVFINYEKRENASRSHFFFKLF